jgi:DNA replication protein DnaC
VQWVRENPVPEPVELPLRYRAADLGQLPNPLLRQVAETYLTDFWARAPEGAAPAFFGQARVGKTMAAACIARTVNRAVSVTWWSMPMWVADPWGWKAQMPFLVCDDIQAVQATGRRAFELFQGVVSDRWDAQLPTVFTGNLLLPPDRELETLSQTFGPGVARRIYDASHDLMVII